MNRELIEYLRAQTLALVELARKYPDHEIAGQLEAMAVHMLMQALAAEKKNSF